MGKRSRQRAEPKAQAAGTQTRKERLRERADRASAAAEKQLKERPSAPWDPFPLTELAIFFGIVLVIVGAIVGDQLGKGLITAGVVLACIGGAETALREHFGGFRSHAGLISGFIAVMVLYFSSAVLRVAPGIAAGVAIAVFGLLFPTLRSSFIRKSGGRGVL